MSSVQSDILLTSYALAVAETARAEHEANEVILNAADSETTNAAIIHAVSCEIDASIAYRIYSVFHQNHEVRIAYHKFLDDLGRSKGEFAVKAFDDYVQKYNTFVTVGGNAVRKLRVIGVFDIAGQISDHMVGESVVHDARVSYYNPKFR